MKKLISILLIVTLIFSMGIFVHASEEIITTESSEVFVEYGPVFGLCDRCLWGNLLQSTVYHTHEDTQTCLRTAGATDRVIKSTTCIYYYCDSCSYKSATCSIKYVNSTQVICTH